MHTYMCACVCVLVVAKASVRVRLCRLQECVNARSTNVCECVCDSMHECVSVRLCVWLYEGAHHE